MRCTTCMARRYFVFTNYYKLVQVSKQIALFSFPLSFALGLLFFLFLHFHLLVKLDFSPTSDFPTEATIYSSYQAFLISSCNLILFSGENIACCTWKTFLCLNCCFTSFSSLKPYINGPQINTMHQVFIFLDCRGQI